MAKYLADLKINRDVLDCVKLEKDEGNEVKEIHPKPKINHP
jgi:hypothetical protein